MDWAATEGESGYGVTVAVEVPRVWRPVSGLEKAWLTADRLASPFVNQLVLEGKGEPEPAAVQAACDRVAEGMPGVCLRLRGWLGGMRWESSGPSPVVRVEDGSLWDGTSADNAPFLAHALDPRRGPVCEVVLLRGSPDGRSRLVIRTHHAALDGRGTELFARDLFRVLRGQDPCGADAGPFTDVDLARLVDVESRSDPPPDRYSPTGSPTSDSFRMVWARVRADGTFRGLLPQAAVALWSASRRYCTDPLRIAVPIDLRRYQPKLRSTANLTGILHIDMAGVDSVAAAHARVRSRLQSGLERHDAAAHVLGVDKIRGLPLWVMERWGRAAAQRGLRDGRFGSSATLSNLGRQDLSRYGGGGLECDRAFWIPPGQPGLPLFVALSGDAEGVELVGSMPEGLASRGRLLALLTELASQLTPVDGRVTQ